MQDFWRDKGRGGEIKAWKRCQDMERQQEVHDGKEIMPGVGM